MHDLRREIAQRLRETLHGREVDLMKEEPLRLEHMLGVIDVGEPVPIDGADGSILDPDHDFWNEWHSDALSGYYVRDKIKTAMHSLKEDDIFRMTYPYGQEAEIVYIEVDELQNSPEQQLQTSCRECGSTLTAVPNLTQDSDYYYLRFSIDCPDCEFSNLYETHLQRV